ncbi:hypothetical protein K6119_15575 [Paracrocinitomix mangrovi]|uniref:hypothetical protein n=1 Tax=Paracrocinitomix mangrovi TaxID=2862509 RepID=UPI001C8CF7C6|nr:hypothetical protein [Paracrocinitomix mangrovi]UKN01149.1 hypothetical protein K6119_15575 [Paracrocinitomix mangrovi]
MKALFSILFLCSGLLLFGQTTVGVENKGDFTTDEDKAFEKAYYEVKQNGETAFTIDVEFKDVPFDVAKFRMIKDQMLLKEGIFKVELIKDNKTIRVCHLSFIEVETIKSFIIPYRQDFDTTEKEPFEFKL